MRVVWHERPFIKDQRLENIVKHVRGVLNASERVCGRRVSYLVTYKSCLLGAQLANAIIAATISAAAKQALSVLSMFTSFVLKRECDMLGLRKEGFPQTQISSNALSYSH